MTVSSPSRRRLLIVAVLLLGAAAAWWMCSADPESGARVGALERAGGTPEREPPPLLTEPVLQGAMDAEPPAVEAPTPPATTWRLTFEVLGPDGRPKLHTHAHVLDSQGEVRAEHYPSDDLAQGGEVQVVGRGRLVVYAHHLVPFASAWLDPPPSGTMHLVARVEAGLAVAGVLYEPDGTTPVTSGQVQLWQRPQTDPFAPAISSRAGLIRGGGRFRIEGLRPGPVKLRAEVYDAIVGKPVSVDAEAGDEGLVLVLGPAGGIAVELVDEETGLGITTRQFRIFVSEDGRERMWSWMSTSATSPPILVKKTTFQTATPGSSYRFRAEAHGYEPSGEVLVEVPPTGGRRTARIAMRAAPDSESRLTLRLRTGEAALPTWINVVQHLGQGSRNLNSIQPVDEQIVLTLAPGKHHLAVGGGLLPRRDNPDTFWVPVYVDLDLSSGDDREVDVWLVRGGWVVMPGDCTPRPRQVTFTQGEQILRGPAHSGLLEDGPGYALAVLPPGTWLCEWTDRDKGCRAKVEVKAGEVTRVLPAMLEAFTVGAED